MCHIFCVNVNSKVAAKRQVIQVCSFHEIWQKNTTLKEWFLTPCIALGKNANEGNMKTVKWTGMYCMCGMCGVWCRCVFQCVGVRSSYSFINGGWGVFVCVCEGSRSCRETNRGALCRVFRWTRPTDTTWCPSSPLPTPSRTPRTTSRRRRAPSWARSSNMVMQNCRSEVAENT